MKWPEGILTVADAKTYTTLRIEHEMAEEIRGMVVEVEYMGLGGLPEDQLEFFTRGISRSAVVKAALHELRKTWKVHREGKG